MLLDALDRLDRWRRQARSPRPRARPPGVRVRPRRRAPRRRLCRSRRRRGRAGGRAGAADPAAPHRAARGPQARGGPLRLPGHADPRARGLEGSGPRQQTLLAGLRARYKHALIDEFQDTDEVQWSIFRRIFFASPGHVLTVIGDPKQAIYCFRGADVHTYLRARGEIEAAGGARLPLTANFRSTAAAHRRVQRHPRSGGAVLPARGRDPLRPPGDLRPPRPGPRRSAGRARPRAGRAGRRDRGEVAGHLAGQAGGAGPHGRRDPRAAVARDGPLLGPPGARTPLRPRDVFVLTRTTRESREIGEVLRAARIPFAFFKQERLFETVEAREVLDLLRAIVDPDDRTARARAFITPFFAPVPDRPRGLRGIWAPPTRSCACSTSGRRWPRPATSRRCSPASSTTAAWSAASCACARASAR